MKKIIALSGISLALFVAGLIFFANSSAKNASANEAEQSANNQTTCPYFAENGTCTCVANNGTCNCGKNGNGICDGTAKTNKQENQTKTTCGCQNNQ